MIMKKTQPLYNAFFARSLQYRVIMEAFLDTLPEPLRSQIDRDTLVRSDSVGINEELKEHRQDITYRVRLLNGGILVIRIEHQSSPDGSMLIRFLHYAADSIEACCQDHGETPIIMQFLIYHGEQTPYPYHTSLEDCYRYPKLGILELAARFHLFDLTRSSDEELLRYGHCAPLLLSLKHARTVNFNLSIDSYRPTFQNCIAAVGDAYLRSMLDYTASLNPRAGKIWFKFLKEVLENKQDNIMTYGEQLIQQGVQQGEQARSLEIARNMYQSGEPLERVSRWTGLSEASILSL